MGGTFRALHAIIFWGACKRHTVPNGGSKGNGRPTAGSVVVPVVRILPPDAVCKRVGYDHVFP